MMKVLVIFISMMTTMAYGFSVFKRTGCSEPVIRGSHGSCGCQDNVLKCRNIDSIPFFDIHTYYKEVDLSENIFGRNIHNGTTLNINTTVLNLHNSGVRFLGSGLFRDMNNLKSLNLSSNSLTKLPDVLSTLTNLVTLDISDNPILDIDFTEDVMRHLGKSLKRFSFGSADITQWPPALKHLPMLEELTVTRANIYFLPENAFFGFDKTLKKLTIQNTLLRSVPIAIAQLTFLEVLNFDHNIYVRDEGMNVPYGVGRFFHFLKNISLQDDRLSTFPKALKEFSNLSSLIIGNQNLKFVSDVAAESVHQIQHLSMSNANITRIPDALQDIDSLKSLDLSDNNIHSIDQPDIGNLRKLETLNLNYNPIAYISDDAFTENTALRTIELRNSKLTKVPCALENFLTRLLRTSIRHVDIKIDMRETPIECTCELKWLDDVINGSFKARGTLAILGNCDTVEMSIQDYIRQQLPTCPSSGPCSRNT